MAETDKLPWYALYVHSRAEKKVYEQLLKMGYEAYLPLVTKMKKWSDRLKKVEEPLFKSYLFVRADIRKYYDIVQIPGVTKFVKFENQAVVVPQNQINAIKKYCDDYVEEDEKAANMDLHEGQLVRITSGAMTGLIGRLAPIDNKRRLNVYIEAVGQYLCINIPRTKVEPVGKEEQKQEARSKK